MQVNHQKDQLVNQKQNIHLSEALIHSQRDISNNLLQGKILINSHKKEYARPNIFKFEKHIQFYRNQKKTILFQKSSSNKLISLKL
ncbi:unnamed protein product [Paramecium sonneborni]|uniref:Uncharacterized protein n=1 Tax=Paramecium sonneborni TaxID=65129 RepID=A0A8S1RI91_9CILI|nr:unnamed protein product [Paramecium sonneborni]